MIERRVDEEEAKIGLWNEYVAVELSE